jgi:very-short-patch-repair endonuclease
VCMLYGGLKTDTPKYVIELAREQRRNLTESEQLMWSQLKSKQLHGYRFRCQHPIYRYILDFYCHKAMLAIEIDGESHKYRKDYDNYRDEFIASIGIRTLRFSNNEVFSNIENVINQIGDALLKHNI